MELSSLKNKKFQEVRNRARKNKKTYSEKISHILGEWNFSFPKFKKVLHFFQKQFFLYFGEWNFLTSSPKEKVLLTFLE